MADTSPGLQNLSSNYLAELGHTSADHPLSNLAVQKETSARLASEFLAGPGEQSGGTAGFARAAKVLAGGLADGVVDSAEHSLNWHTAETVASSLGLGYGLGALAKAGPVGQKLAMIGGAAMGLGWVYSEIKGGRPQATVAAVADAYDSKAHATQDRQIVATNGGALAFETGLAFAAGGLGMKKGLELKTNWQVDALANVKSTYGTAVDFLARDGRVNGAHVLSDGNLGLAFAGKDANAPAGVMSLAKEIISGKDKGATSLNDIQQTFARSEVKRNDTHLLDTRSKLVDLEAQHSRIKADESALAPKLTTAAKEKAALESLAPLEQTVKFREQTLANARKDASEITGKKRELDKLFTEKQAAFELQKPKDGVPSAPALRADFQAKHQNFQETKAKYDALKETGSSESIERHSAGLEEAKVALTQARQEQPAKMAVAQQNIDALNEQASALKTQRLAIEDQVKTLVEAYNTRLDAVIKDPTQLVQAKFDPPAPKAATLKAEPIIKATAPSVLANLDLQPGFVKPGGEVITRGGDTAGGTTMPHTETVVRPAAIVETTVEPLAKSGKPEPQVTEVTPPAIVAEKAPGTFAVNTERTATGGQTAVHERNASDTAGDRTSKTADAPGVQVLSKEAQISREAALKSVKSNELVREKEYAIRVLSDIERGAYKPARGASVADVKIEMERRLTDVNEKLKGDPGIKYTRAMKSVMQYSRSIGKQLAETPNSGLRDGIATQALTDIEGMMGRLPTSYKGYPGKLPDLMEPNRLGRMGSPESRFADVSNHLEAKVANLDGSRVKQISDMIDRQPTLSEIMKRLNEGKLPDDASIIIINKDGKYSGPPNGTSPFFIEVARMKDQGVGADGGGFYRLERTQDDIAGAVILRPIYEGGKPVELPGKSNGGKPVYKKTVAETIGDVPATITPGLNFVDILRRFAPPRS